MLKYISILKKQVLFKDIPMNILSDLLVNHTTILELPKKSKILEQGSLDDSIYILVQGVVKVFRNVGEKEIIYLFLEEGDLIMNLNYLFEQKPCEYFVECVSSCTVLCFPHTILANILQHVPSSFCNVGRAIEVFHDKYKEHIDDVLSPAPTIDKINLLQRRFQVWKNHLSNKDIASYLGISPEIVTRIKKKESQSRNA